MSLQRPPARPPKQAAGAIAARLPCSRLGNRAGSRRPGRRRPRKTRAWCCCPLALAGLAGGFHFLRAQCPAGCVWGTHPPRESSPFSRGGREAGRRVGPEKPPLEEAAADLAPERNESPGLRFPWPGSPAPPPLMPPLLAQPLLARLSPRRERQRK